MVFKRTSFPATLLIAGSLSLAVANVTHSWAMPEDEDVAAGAELMSPDIMTKLLGNTGTTRSETPADIKFTSGHLEASAEGVQLILDVVGGVPTDMPDILQAEDKGDVTTLTLKENHKPGSVQALNSKGTYAQVKVRRLHVTLEEFEQGPAMDAENPVFEDNIYKAYRQLLTVLSIRKDYTVRDSLLQSNSSIVILRANGDIEIQLYRRGADEGLEYMGQILADKELRYEMKGTNGPTPDFIIKQNEIQNELLALEQQIKQQSEQVVQMMVSGERENLQPLMDEIDEMKIRFRELYQQIPIPSEFEFFAISEHLDYAANQFVKWKGEDGLEVTSQVVANQVLADLSAAAVVTNGVLERSQHALAESQLPLNLLAKFEGKAAGENIDTYITRMLHWAWSALKGDTTRPIPYTLGKTLGIELDGFRQIVTHKATALENVDAAIKWFKENPGQEALVAIPQDHQTDIINAVNRTSFWQWIKHKFDYGDYQKSELAEKAQQLVKDRNLKHVDQLFVSDRRSSTDTIALGDKAKLAKLANGHKKLIEAEVDNQQQVSRLTSLSNGLYNTGAAAMAGGFTAYTLQGAMDVGSKYYNERVLPWDYTAKESEELNRRAMKTGLMGAVSAAINNRALSYLTSRNGDFSGMSSALQNTGISAHRYTGALAGAAASVGTNALAAGYSYYQGDIDGTEFAYKVADAGVRAVPTFIGSAVGHYLFPYSTTALGLAQTPILGAGLGLIEKAIGPSIGSLAGSIAGNVLYDTAKYHLYNSSKYFYGTGAKTESVAPAANDDSSDGSQHDSSTEQETAPVNDTVAVQI